MRTIGAWFLLLMAGVASGSESILIKPGDCESGIHLVAQRAPLSDVLKRLADVLGFQLQLGDSSDSVIDTDISRQRRRPRTESHSWFPPSRPRRRR